MDDVDSGGRGLWIGALWDLGDTLSLMTMIGLGSENAGHSKDNSPNIAAGGTTIINPHRLFEKDGNTETDAIPTEAVATWRRYQGSWRYQQD